MLSPSGRNPKISAPAMLEGKFDFNKTPLVPQENKFTVQEKPNIRGTLGQHGVQGWYIGLSVENYRCYKVYISNTIA